MRISFFATYRNISGVRSVDLPIPAGSSISQAIRIVLQHFPQLTSHWQNEAGELHAHLTVVLNYIDCASLPGGLETRLKSSDELYFIPPVGGGA
jgi:MoaD family protein